jgi:hypothetical protein
MEAISGRKTIQEIAADHAIEIAGLGFIDAARQIRRQAAGAVRELQHGPEVVDQLHRCCWPKRMGSGDAPDQKGEPVVPPLRRSTGYGVDRESGPIHSVETTAANVHDLTPAADLLHGVETLAYSDAGYLGLVKFLRWKEGVLGSAWRCALAKAAHYPIQPRGG